MSGSVHIIIVNWNTGGHLRDCLASIADEAVGGPPLNQVTVVDNASSDDSVDGIENLPVPLEVIRNRENVGFAAACNQGASGSTADYLLFLNPDTRLFPDTLATVTTFMEGEQATGVGICGVQMVNRDGRPAISCARFPTLRVLIGKMTGLASISPQLFPSHHLTPHETPLSGVVDQVIGAFYFVRHDLFVQLGGFDERYFIYFEEVDFALRARRLGMGTYFLKEANAFHAENVSSDQVPDIRLYHSLRSRFLFAYRHWPRWQARTLVVATFIVELPARLIRTAVNRSRPEARATVSGYRKLLGDLLGLGTSLDARHKPGS